MAYKIIEIGFFDRKKTRNIKNIFFIEYLVSLELNHLTQKRI